MTEREYIFSTALRNKVITKVFGGVKTWITNDEQFVSIRVSEYGIEWVYSISDISTKMLNGYTTDYAVYEVMEAYKKYLNMIFLKH